MSATHARRSEAVQRRKGDRLVPLNTEAVEITKRSYWFLMKAKNRREFTVVQAGPGCRVFVWESDLLAWLASHERRAIG